MIIIYSKSHLKNLKKEESESGKNLLVHFLLTTKYYEISQTKYRYSFLLLTNIHAFAEKVENPQKSVANLV